ncbi:uncharacterized protein BYT42DRAFT_610213 [Radiomyces spectabilis]|uniref:uncharacterized protein n=1 Tax=Radiomyces spectabilis TaxID=64574 RepID=UPI00221F177B|nr:uncharacterized protein BYT42DRAFT_610213 [Radiomyces spectabilis]KAI8390944.1 hypothetical protein BYT42DRAFT_610213 [Radiomyces spectabilis]
MGCCASRPSTNHEVDMTVSSRNPPEIGHSSNSPAKSDTVPRRMPLPPIVNIVPASPRSTMESGSGFHLTSTMDHVDDPPSESKDDNDTNPSMVQIASAKDSHDSNPPSSWPILVRLSSTAQDIQLEIPCVPPYIDTVGLRRLLYAHVDPTTQQIRLIHLGKLLQDSSLIVPADITTSVPVSAVKIAKRGVIQAMISKAL